MSRFKFKYQLVIYFLIIVAFIITSIFISLYISFKSSYQDKENEMLITQAHQAVQNIENQAEYYTDYLDWMLKDEGFTEALQKGDMKATKSYLEALADNFIQMNPAGISQISLYKDGYYDYLSEKKHIHDISAAFLGSQARGQFVTGTYLNTRNEKVISIFKPFYSIGLGKKYYIELCLYETEFYSFISSDQSGNDICVYYGDRLISMSDRSSFWKLLRGGQKTDSWDKNAIQISAGNDNGWNVSITTNTDYLNRGFYNAIKSIILQIFLIVCLTVFFILMISRYFNTRMRIVRQKIVMMENQAKDGALVVRGNDEFKILADEIDSTSLRIRELMEKIESTNQQRIVTEMSALRAQINSHFLFNALSTLKWLSYNDSQKHTLVQAIDHLAVFLRYSISLSENTVALSSELSHLEAYIYFQKLRAGDSLNIVIDVDEELFSCPTVKLILQPLVENSIYHGRKGFDENLNIMIYSEYDDNFYDLVIEDDGQGMDEAAIRQVYEGTAGKESGYGIRNIIRRLKLCSPQSEFNIYGEPGKYTKIVIRQRRFL